MHVTSSDKAGLHFHNHTKTKMSGSKSFPAHPQADILRKEQPNITEIPLTSPEEVVADDVFDSRDNPEVKQYFSTSVSRPRGPRKLGPKPADRDLSSSASATGTEASFVTSYDLLVSSQGDSEDDEAFQSRSDRRHSGVIDISLHLSKAKLRQELATVRDKCSQLTKLIVNLERKAESDTTQIEELQDVLKITRNAKNSLEPRMARAEKELADLQDINYEILAKNMELEGLNKLLRKETAQARIDEEKCRLINCSMVNQIAELKEDIFRRSSFTDRLKENNVNLIQDRDVYLAEAERARDKLDLLASRQDAYQNVASENLALKQEVEAIRSYIEKIEEQQNGLQDDLWRYDGARLATPDRSNTSVRRNSNHVAGSQTPQRQKLINTPALTNASSPSTSSLASPQSIVSPARGDGISEMIRKLVLGNHGSLGGRADDSNNAAHQEHFGGPSAVPGLGIIVHSPAQKLKAVAKVAASVQSPATHADGQTQTVNSALTEQNSRVDEMREHELLVEKASYISTSVQTESETVGRRVDKSPCLEAQAKATPKEIFELMEPVTSINEDDGVLQAPIINVGTGMQAPANNGFSSMSTLEPLIRPVTDHELPQMSDSEAVCTAVSAKPRWPLWYHVALSSLIMLLLTHAFFEERRFWRNANELTRHAVVGMRDEWWGSEWVEKIGYSLDQKIGVDRTGFC